MYAYDTHITSENIRGEEHYPFNTGHHVKNSKNIESFSQYGHLQANSAQFT